MMQNPEGQPAVSLCSVATDLSTTPAPRVYACDTVFIPSSATLWVRRRVRKRGRGRDQ